MRRFAIFLLALTVAASSLAGQQRTSARTSLATQTPAKAHKPVAKRSGAKAKSVPRTSSTAPLRGSLAILQRQDMRLEAEQLESIEDSRDLAARVKNGLLVPLPVSNDLTVDSELARSRRYCRPWTATYLKSLARDHQAAFHSPLEVSSAVRTVAYQKLLKRTNSNAAPAEGDLFSPHVMGATVDLSKGDLTRAEILWLRSRLRADSAAGKIDVEEEFSQACFHITVYKPRTPAAATQAQARLQNPAPSSRSQPGKGTGIAGAGNRETGTSRQAARGQVATNQARMGLLY